MEDWRDELISCRTRRVEKANQVDRIAVNLPVNCALEHLLYLSVIMSAFLLKTREQTGLSAKTLGSIEIIANDIIRRNENTSAHDYQMMVYAENAGLVTMVHASWVIWTVPKRLQIQEFVISLAGH